MLRVAGGEYHISVFSKIMNFHWVLSLLSAYTPHSYQQGYFIFITYPSLLSAGIFHLYHIPLTPISFAKLLNEFRSYFLLALLNYLMNLGAISY